MLDIRNSLFDIKLLYFFLNLMTLRAEVLEA